MDPASDAAMDAIREVVTDADAAGTVAIDPTDLLRRWSDLVGSGPAEIGIGTDLLRRWAEPHRRYHDLAHLAAVLAAVDRLVEAEPATAADARAVRLAAFFHDAVYDPAAPDNEQRSAALVAECLGDLGLAGPLVPEVVRLVQLTATHEVGPSDGNGAVLCDADLAVLAGSPEAYAAYAAAVRAEYAHVPEPIFRAGRAAVLAGLLEHEVLFRTEAGRAWWEAAARHNLETELVLLRAPTGDAGEADGARPPGAG